jgi:membrane protein implicated in regulation of membrane protease activity
MAWSVWLLLGAALVLVELMTPGGFYFIFFASAALIVGLLVASGLVGPAWSQGLLFSLLSIASLLLFRKRLLEMFRPSESLTEGMADVVGGVVVLLEDLAPDALGKAEFRGTRWAARNAAQETLKSGQRCRIERIEGLTLFVKAERA